MYQIFKSNYFYQFAYFNKNDNVNDNSGGGCCGGDENNNNNDINLFKYGILSKKL